MFKFLLNCVCLKSERERITETVLVIQCEEVDSVNINTIPEHRQVILYKSHSVKSHKAEIIDINIEEEESR